MSEKTKTLLPEDWRVPARFRARLGREAGRQRAILEEGHLLLILHEAKTRRPRIYWREPDGTWHLAGAMSTTLQSLRRHLDEFAARSEELAARLEAAEKAGDYFAVLQDSAPFHRQTRGLHKALQDARDGVGDDRDLISLRDRAYELEREAELLHGDAKNGLDYCVARRAEEQAISSARIEKASHRLNLLAAMCLPLTAIASMLGMNVPTGLEGHAGGILVFWTVVAASLFLGLWVRRSISSP